MGRREWWASGGAAILVAAMHGLLVATVMFGGGRRKGPAPPDQAGAGASALASVTQVPDSMQLINLQHVDPSRAIAIEEVASVGIELPRAALVIASLDSLPPPVLEIDLAEESETTEAAGDALGHAAMFGRYIGQISARVERAWLRPRGDIGERFSCQTKIEQDLRGYVLSVELRHCNGDARWQRSLVVAIEHASPLPSPPVPSVFSRTLVLDFSASPYEAGVSSASQYEPGVDVAANVEPTRSYEATNTSNTLGEAARRSGHIELRIVGKNTTWTVREPSEQAPDQTEMEQAGMATPPVSQRKEL